MAYNFKIIIGLGNPGPKYKFTRHNAGFIALDALAEQQNAAWRFNKKFNAETAETANAILAKPQTFMNNSGQTARAILDYYKLLPKKLGWLAKKNTDLTGRLIIVHDDIDIELGKFKTQSNRSAAGHRGVQSIISRLKTQNFTRVRIGIKHKSLSLGHKIPAEKFVLKKFSGEEIEELKKLIPEIAESVIKMLDNIKN